jgi:DpnII restriction endonuclease
MARNRAAIVALLYDRLLKVGTDPRHGNAGQGLKEWCAAAGPMIQAEFPDQLERFKEATTAPKWQSEIGGGVVSTEHGVFDNREEARTNARSVNWQRTEDWKRRLVGFMEGLQLVVGSEGALVPRQAPVDRVLHILDRFPWAVGWLAKRQRGRTPLAMKDEYDVQYLLPAMLCVDFDDVRDEEPTPSRAGRSARMDFFLKKERIVVEAKVATKDNNVSKIRGQLIQDIRDYAEHRDCDVLVCFVYDPHRVIKNPAALNDLAQDERPRVYMVVKH